MNMKITYPKLTAEEIDEIEQIAERLGIGLEAAEYVMRLERKLERMEEKLSELWDDYRQR